MIRLKRLYIRELNEMDCELLISWWGNGGIMKDVGFPDGLKVNKETLLKNIRS